MVAKTLSLPAVYDAKIKRACEALGISQSELVRRAIDEYLEKLGIPLIELKNNISGGDGS